MYTTPWDIFETNKLSLSPSKIWTHWVNTGDQNLQNQSVNTVSETQQPLFRAGLKANEILTAVLAAQNEIWAPVSEIISNLLKEMLKNGSYQIKTGKQSPNGKFLKVWRKINDRLSSWLLLLCHPKSYLAIQGGGEMRTHHCQCWSSSLQPCMSVMVSGTDWKSHWNLVAFSFICTEEYGDSYYERLPFICELAPLLHFWMAGFLHAELH